MDDGEDDRWWEQGRCQGLGDLFFSDDVDEQVVAKSLCAECPVRARCLLFAVEEGVTDGIWAGHTVAELEEGLRDSHRRRARASGHPSSRPPAGAVPELRTEPGNDAGGVVHRLPGSAAAGDGV